MLLRPTVCRFPGSAVIAAVMCRLLFYTRSTEAAEDVRLYITPPSLHVSQEITNVTIMCKASQRELHSCQFTWRDQLNNHGPLIDLSQGRASQANVSLLSPHLIGYSYHGQGLNKGECGIAITIRGWKLWMLGCRAHASHGGWKYAWMSLIARDYDPISMVVVPQEQMVLPAGNVSLMCRARNQPVANCNFRDPRSLHFRDFSEGHKSFNSSGRHLYHGKGLHEGDCGLKLVNVSNIDNGPFICDISTSAGWEQRYIPLIVARQPSLPVLELLMPSISEGDTLRAKCTVARSRPAPGIIWLLGNKIIRRDKLNDGPVSAEDIWSWPWDLTSISQIISHKLRRENNGEVLRCLVNHVSLTRTRPLEASQKILFTTKEDDNAHAALPQDDNVPAALHKGPDNPSFSLIASPKHVRINKLMNTVTFSCNANVPITKCQFNWFASAYVETPILDCSKGNQTETVTTLQAPGFNEYSYNVDGLKEGKCGITMKIDGYKLWMVGCRVLPAQGGWKYEVMDLFAKNADTHPLTVSPRTSVVHPGETLTVICSTLTPGIQNCLFTIPGSNKKLDFSKGRSSPHSSHGHLYEGRGLSKGECGLRLTNVTESNNGAAYCELVDQKQVHHLGSFQIIVAKPPQVPTLSVNSDTHVDGNLNASCSVAGSRPEPNITWYLGDRIIKQGSLNNMPSSDEDKWMWPWSTTALQQKLNYTLKPGDDGKTLKCVVSHIALTKSLEAAHQIALSNPTKYCNRLRSSSVEMSCSYKCKPVLCNNRHLPTTVALLTCKEGFSSTSEETNRTITCQENGQWSDKPLTCSTGCGLRSSITEFSIGGAEAELKDHPWHVGVYQKLNGTFTHICGGTLVSTSYVISAAHCFWNSKAGRPLDDVKLYMISAGKHNRQWDPKEDHEQRKNVDRIFVHDRYRHGTTHYRYDIAILRLVSPVKLVRVVKLACLDDREEVTHEQLVEGNKGTVAGWGIKEGGVYSDVLLAVDLPYVPYIHCLDTIPPESRAYLTFDKFCAGFKGKGTSVCSGDSGGGFIVQQRSTGRFFLQGIVSTNFKTGRNREKGCYAQHYTSFTQISFFYDWIKKIISI